MKEEKQKLEKKSRKKDRKRSVIEIVDSLSGIVSSLEISTIKKIRDARLKEKYRDL